MRRAGFTLVELMVSVALLGVVVVYLLQTFTVQHRTYTVVDEVTEMQQNMRAVSDLLERDLRHAGMMVPEGAAVCGLDNAAGLGALAPFGIRDNTDVLFVSDADAIVPGDEKSADFAADLDLTDTNVNGNAADALDVDALVAEPSPPLRAAYDLNGDGTTDSDFRAGAGVIVTDPGDPGRGAACGVVTADPTTSTLNVRILTAALGAGPSGLAVVPAHVYAVSPGLQLLRDGQVLAENVEDLQVAYLFDANENGVADAGEYQGDGVGPDYLANPASDVDTVREVRFNVVARTRFADPENNVGQFQITENSPAVAAADGFRRRVQTSTVRLRNVGNR
jgi:prepilin-type N-terminal cleavage/methylation domain-containing protein